MITIRYLRILTPTFKQILIQNKHLSPAIISSSKVRPIENFTIPIRNYAKGKDKKKDKSKGKVHVNEEQLKSVINLDGLKTQMEKSLNQMRDDFIKNLSLRSTSGSIESLPVSFDGAEHELQELGQIVRKNPKTIVINMISFPQAIPQVLEAIKKSGMNLNPQQDGTTLFIPVPKVTKEHRENLSKNAKTLFLKCRDTIKDVQNGFIKKVKNQKDISDDLNHQVQAQITALADGYIREAEKVLDTKQAELLGGKD
uniref:Ribosome-recycling factor, mitochondrial n=1 Tax=Corethrella appendiculata TaxID=1370023 RepID=U5EVR6_9DIPT